ncbi:integral membrane protein [Thermopolyspora flexuosa]|uniref:Peptidase M48-like protein n=1 Tax=Thermopolyspora flexuosa TaxID=103836 RepID=A0A543J2Y0_9ACTN|nr:M56 family metallopeptidase [Thermopolyspora flexuosa]TQM77162.1 peptidase M48-like protein [Thermopolyspora flexuosa]GGM75597.1 integral membrane protein [Thermopolyspora flexuosa]
MIAAVALALLSIGCVVAAWRLPSARWTWRAPRTAILLWQSIGLTWGLASTGALLAYALQPYGQGVIYGLHSHLSSVLSLGPDPNFTYDLSRTIALVAGLALLAVLIGVLLAALWQTLRARQRHRELLALVAREDPHVPGVRILDHPGATAYCVPGLRSEVVVSAGALRLLSRDELAAVLAHEDAHVRERHDLVLLPFAALRRAIPWARVVREAQSSVALLVEMAADDRARRHCSPRRLATALLRFGAAGSLPAPQGALGAGGDVMARVNRLISPAAELPRLFRYGVVALSALLTASAPLLWAMPH